jgi:hypothetical protein
MRGIRFYEEFIDKRRGESAGTVVAVLLDKYQRPYTHWSEAANKSCGGWVVDVISGMFDVCNSEVGVGSASPDYLREWCKRISEKRARAIHPQLFVYLDREEVRHG